MCVRESKREIERERQKESVNLHVCLIVCIATDSQINLTHIEFTQYTGSFFVIFL